MSMRVYISSATREMRDYREAAIRAIRDAGMGPVYLNEGFPPSLDSTLTLLDLNERYVRSCDIIRMYYAPGEHSPPHFHAYYNEYKATVDVRTCEVIEGNFPNRQTKLVLAWAE